MGSLVSDRRLYVTADRGRVVEEGDPAAAFLLASAGGEISTDAVSTYGLAQKAGRVLLTAESVEVEKPAEVAKADESAEPQEEPEPEEKPVVQRGGRKGRR